MMIYNHLWFINLSFKLMKTFLVNAFTVVFIQYIQIYFSDNERWIPQLFLFIITILHQPTKYMHSLILLLHANMFNDISLLWMPWLFNIKVSDSTFLQFKVRPFFLKDGRSQYIYKLKDLKKVLKNFYFLCLGHVNLHQNRSYGIISEKISI